MRRSGLVPFLLAVAAALALLVACGASTWNYVIVPTETTSSSECVSECLAKAAGARYKCYTKCPGSRIAKAASCDGAMAALRADGFTYGGGYQCESSR